MIRVVFDTDIFIDHLHGIAPAKTLIERVKEKEMEVEEPY